MIEPDPAILLTSRILYQFAPEDAPPVKVDTANPALFGVHEFDFVWRPWDVGDAPDSTNHFGAAMTAYPGVQADFPTVIDRGDWTAGWPGMRPPAAAAPGRARGGRAGCGPGAGAAQSRPACQRREPRPLRRRRAIHAWSLTRCQVTSFPVRIFISPAAAARFQQAEAKATLNVWLDGNRDGDWADEPRLPTRRRSARLALNTS